jgi:Single-strand binding protein family
MAGSVNKMILVGHLGRDPEVRHTQSNLKIVHVWMAPVLQGLSCVLLGVACGHVSGPLVRSSHDRWP